MGVNMNGLANKVVIITGAATLIGEAAGRAFIEKGASVVLVDINKEAGQAIADDLGEKALFSFTDITSDNQIDSVIQKTIEQFGGVDFLINIASTYLDEGIATNRQDWLTGLNVNLVSGAIFTQKVASHMATRGGGAIVNYASISGKVAQRGRMVYSASKAGILQITRNQAMALASDNIRVNSVSPGWTWSNIMKELTENQREKADAVAAPFHLLGRTGGPDEVANAALFLCSDEASFITGTDLAVDGGYAAIGPEQQLDAVSKLGN